jgi:hypothetical protein
MSATLNRAMTTTLDRTVNKIIDEIMPLIVSPWMIDATRLRMYARIADLVTDRLGCTFSEFVDRYNIAVCKTICIKDGEYAEVQVPNTHPVDPIAYLDKKELVERIDEEVDVVLSKNPINLSAKFGGSLLPSNNREECNDCWMETTDQVNLGLDEILTTYVKDMLDAFLDANGSPLRTLRTKVAESKAPEVVDHAENRLVVGGLSSNVSSRDLNDLFSCYGPVKFIDMKPGFAVVEMGDQRDVANTKRYLNGYRIDGQCITVTSVPRGKVDSTAREQGDANGSPLRSEGPTPTTLNMHYYNVTDTWTLATEHTSSCTCGSQTMWCKK